MISGNVLFFKDIKISLGLLITVRKMPALFWENHYLKVSTTVNNLIEGLRAKKCVCRFLADFHFFAGWS